jgi:hypothetical protein
MTSQSPWVYRGAFIPFPLPIPAITTSPLASGDTGLCWADDWTPAILGALKALTRPETWSGDPADIVLAMEGAQQLLSGLVDGCGGGEFPLACGWDFTDTFGDWTITPYAQPPWSANRGQWLFGFGVENTTHSAPGAIVSGADIFVMFPSPVLLSQISLRYTFSPGNFDGAVNGEVLAAVLHAGGVTDVHRRFDLTVAGNYTESIVFGTPTLVDAIECSVICGDSATDPGMGACLITAVDLVGSGDGPPTCT